MGLEEFDGDYAKHLSLYTHEFLKSIIASKDVRSELRSLIQKNLKKVKDLPLEEQLLTLGFLELPYTVKALLFEKLKLDLKKLLEELQKRDE